jgi:hypothetical protein
MAGCDLEHNAATYSTSVRIAAERRNSKQISIVVPSQTGRWAAAIGQAVKRV